jgi:hypothetical protein
LQQTSSLFTEKIKHAVFLSYVSCLHFSLFPFFVHFLFISNYPFFSFLPSTFSLFVLISLFFALSFLLFFSLFFPVFFLAMFAFPIFRISVFAVIHFRSFAYIHIESDQHILTGMRSVYRCETQYLG